MSSSSAPVATRLSASSIPDNSIASASMLSKIPTQSKPDDVQILEYSTIVEQDQHSLDPWGKAIQRVIKAIVSIKGRALRTFDTDGAGVYEGTGFVVDRTRGIILSNRHIVNQGPVTATAVFGNYEEISLKQDYYDPVHDFGFFRYDCSKVKFAEVEEIELYPQGAKVGLDIKVCGNDAGEKLSILGSTLARLDRTAPYYGTGYNDFNINYFQAASGTSSGSSGSPVLDIKGRAVALNASGSLISASAFFLPLEPVVRALKFVQEGKKVPRGTLQTVFAHSSYDELKRIGLPQEVEKQCRERNKAGTGLLSVRRVLPEGPGYSAGMEVGDVLVECYQEAFGLRYIDSFNSLWEIIDESVGKQVVFTIYRGQQKLQFNVTIQDLHSITPNTFVEIGNACVHPLSYQLARTYHMPCKGLYMATSGIFNWASAAGDFLITQLAEKPVDSLESFIEIYLSIEDGKKVSFRYMMLGEGEDQLGIVEIDHHFYVSAQYTRDGVWKRKVLTPKPVVELKGPSRAPTLMLQEGRNENMRKILVMIRSRPAYSVDGVPAAALFSGVGLLVATSPIPLIVTSRDTVPISICDISITVGKRNIAARILYFGVIVVITVDAGRIPPLISIPSISDKEYKIGDAVEVFGLNCNQLIHRKTEIDSITAVTSVPVYPPRWRISNTEGYGLLDSPACEGGVLIDSTDDSIVALWMPMGVIFMGLDYRYYIRPIIKSLQAGEEIRSWCPGWDFMFIHLVRAMDLGMPEHHATRIENIAQTIGVVPQAIWVCKKLRYSAQDLEVGDFILEIDEEPVGRMADIHRLSQAESSRLLVLRSSGEKEIILHSKPLSPYGTSRIICWAGAVLQQCTSAALEQITPEFLRVAEKEGITNPEVSVYINSLFSGSPANGVLVPSQWILEIEGYKVRELDDMLTIITALKGKDDSEEYIRIKLLSSVGTTAIAGLKLNPHFWPAWILERKEEKWVRTELE